MIGPLLSRGHAPDCRFRVAETYAVPVECDHGYDVCPTCDPCTCKETVTHDYNCALNDPTPIIAGESPRMAALNQAMHQCTCGKGTSAIRRRRAPKSERKNV